MEEEGEELVELGAGRGKDKAHHPLRISVQKVSIRLGKGKEKSDGWFPQPLTHNSRPVCTNDPEAKLPMHSLCSTREGEREWYGVTTPNILSGQGVILFPFGATPPLIGKAEEVVAAEPLEAFNRDPNDLVVTTRERLVVNHLIVHVFLSAVQLVSLLVDLDRVPLSEKAPIFNENPPHCGQAPRFKDVWQVWGCQPPQAQPPQAPRCAIPQKGSQIVCLRRRRRVWWGGVGWRCTIRDMAQLSSYDHTP